MRTDNPDTNCFNFLRLIAALAVILSHSFPLVGLAEPTPIAGQTFGSLAVAMFFALSGFLVSQSWTRDRSIRRFALRRMLRIFPGLIVVTLFTALLLGPALSALSLPEYLSHKETWAYIPITSLALNVPGLPGLFETNVFPFSNNGSLWTLRYEIMMYAVLCIVGAIVPAARFRLACLTLFCAFAIGWIALTWLGMVPLQVPFVWHLGTELYLDRICNLGAYFFAGCSLFLLRDRIPLSLPIAAALGMVCVLNPNALSTSILLWIAVPYAAITIAFKGPSVLRLFNGFDWSYGVYIYAFPVQQTFAQLLGPSQPSWVGCLIASTVTTLVLAALSWRFVESPALALKTSLIKGKEVRTRPL